jgi:hypothetical protein
MHSAPLTRQCTCRYSEESGGLWLGTADGIVGLTPDLTVTAWLSLQCRAWVLGSSAALLAVGKADANATPTATTTAAAAAAQNVDQATSAWHAVGLHATEAAALRSVRLAFALGVETVVADARRGAAASANASGGPAKQSVRGGTSESSAPPPLSPHMSACKSIAVVPHDFIDGVRTDVWAGGNGYLQFWRGGASRCTMCWNTGRAKVIELRSNVVERVMCAASSDGWVLIFGLLSGRPIRKLKCHDDMVSLHTR